MAAEKVKPPYFRAVQLSVDRLESTITFQFYKTRWNSKHATDYNVLLTTKTEKCTTLHEMKGWPTTKIPHKMEVVMVVNHNVR